MKLDSIKIQNFKSLKNIDIKLSDLTLITGVNSSGKSSFIQSLLLFKENFAKILFECIYREPLEKNKKVDLPKKTISFNGKYINMGDKRLLCSQEASSDDMIFEIKANEGKLAITIDQKFEIKYNKDANSKVLDIFAIRSFNYLNTDRTAPALTFAFSKDIDDHSIGINGEYTAHYLAENRHQNLAVKGLKHPNSETLQLLENTYKWLGEISSGVSILASSDPSTQSAKLTYQYEYGDNTTSTYSPLNVGFGLTYVLPVIVLLLKAKPNDLLIIENPESHLHPAGQAKIAEMCAIAADNGVQIIIESHSDHFLNGLRVATKNKIISPDKSQIYFFEKDGLDTVAQPINIDKDGKIDNWREGFFDEWDNQLDKLLW